jgi:hypothetical protein
MPIDHLVLFKVKEGTAKELVDKMTAGLRGLVALDIVQNLTFGENFSPRGKGFTHALSVRFASRDDLDVLWRPNESCSRFFFFFFFFFLMCVCVKPSPLTYFVSFEKPTDIRQASGPCQDCSGGYPSDLR